MLTVNQPLGTVAINGEFRKGDRVKLTAKAAQTAQKGFSNLRRKNPPDWGNRRGKVAHSTNAGSGCVLVTWDDAKWPDSWPKRAVELVNEDEENVRRELHRPPPRHRRR